MIGPKTRAELYVKLATSILEGGHSSCETFSNGIATVVSGIRVHTYLIDTVWETHVYVSGFDITALGGATAERDNLRPLQSVMQDKLTKVLQSNIPK